MDLLQDFWHVIAYCPKNIDFIITLKEFVWFSCPNDFFGNTSKACHLVVSSVPRGYIKTLLFDLDLFQVMCLF